MCDKYLLEINSTCNIETHGDSKLHYFSSDIQCIYWELKNNDQGVCGEKSMLTPLVYENDKNMRATMGVCGHKYQLVNKSTYVAYDFTLYRANAISLIASAAAASLLSIAF